MVSYHARVPEDFAFADFIVALCDAAEYMPLIATTRAALAHRLLPFEVGLPDLPRQQEALAPKDGSALILARLQPAGGGKHTYLELLGLAEGTPPKLAAFVDDVTEPELELATGPAAGAWKAARLHERLGEPGFGDSPLAHGSFRSGLRHLEDDAVRQDLSRLAAAMGVNPVSIDLLEELDAFKESGSALNRILHEATLIQRQFVVTCPDCGSLLAFGERERAKRAVAAATGRCGACGHEGLRIEEHCAFTQHMSEAVARGLWLTALAARTLADHCRQIWAYPSPAGLDLMAVYLDQTLFIACRDGELAARDLFHTLMEARQLEADLCLVTASSSLSSKIRTAVHQAGGRPLCRAVGEPHAGDLQQALAGELAAVRGAYVGHWLGRDAGGDGPLAAPEPVADLVSQLA